MLLAAIACISQRTRLIPAFFTLMLICNPASRTGRDRGSHANLGAFSFWWVAPNLVIVGAWTVHYLWLAGALLFQNICCGASSDNMNAESAAPTARLSFPGAQLI